jgi:hypothetical protein
VKKYQKNIELRKYPRGNKLSHSMKFNNKIESIDKVPKMVLDELISRWIKNCTSLQLSYERVLEVRNLLLQKKIHDQFIAITISKVWDVEWNFAPNRVLSLKRRPAGSDSGTHRHTNKKVGNQEKS